MQNFKVYRDGQYDIKANTAIKLEKLGTVLEQVDHWFFKELGKN